MFSVYSVIIIWYSAGDTSLKSWDTFVGDSSGNVKSNLGASDQREFVITETGEDRMTGSGFVGAGFKDVRSDASSSGIPFSLYSWEIQLGFKYLVFF